jgi:hypothetical protein
VDNTSLTRVRLIEYSDGIGNRRGMVDASMSVGYEDVASTREIVATCAHVVEWITCCSWNRVESGKSAGLQSDNLVRVGWTCEPFVMLTKLSIAALESQ